MIKKTLYIFIGISLILGGYFVFKSSSKVSLGVQVSVPSAPNAGKLLQSVSTGNWGLASLTAGTNITISTTTTNITISSTASGASPVYPFTTQTYGASTSTTLGLLQGFFTTASSTVRASTFNVMGLSNGCLQIASNLLTSTGSACGAGTSSGGADFPNVALWGNSTSTRIGFLAGLNASSTSIFDNATSTLFTTTRLYTSTITSPNNNLLLTFSSGTGDATINGASANRSYTLPNADGTFVEGAVLGTFNHLAYWTDFYTIKDATNLTYSGGALGMEGGFVSNASSTILAPLQLSTLSAGQLNVGANGLLYSGASTTFSGGLTYANGNVTCSGCGAAGNPDLIYLTRGGTAYYTASSTATDNKSWLFNNGFLSTASSTINNTLYLANLGQGFATIGSGGNVSSISSSTIKTSWLTNDAGFTTNTGTVTSITNGTGLVNQGTAITTSGTITSAFASGTTPTIGRLAMFGSTGSGSTSIILSDVATSSASCSGGVSCSPFTVLGSVSPLISSFSYPFPAGATSSPISFTGLVTMAQSSTTVQASFQHASTTIFTFGGITGSKWSDFCTSITGSATLCDGDDASGGGSSFGFPFTINTGYNSTTTIIGFNGLFSTASTTFSGPLHLPLITSSFLSTDALGNVYGSATSSIKTSQLTNDAGFTTNTGTVTSLTVGTGHVNNGSVITTSGTITGAIATSATPTIGNLAYWTGAGSASLSAGLGTVATSVPTVTAPITYSGTLGSFVGGVGGTFGCTSASTSVTGCLTSGDWNIFNNKANSKWATSTDLYTIYPTGQMVSIGTSTSRIFPLMVASSTAPQLALGSGSGTDAIFVQRVGGNSFTIATASPATLATTSTSNIFTLNQNGALCIGLGCTPMTTSGLYIRDQEGTGPTLYMGGNPGGDTDYQFKRFPNNDTTSNDRLSLGIGDIGNNPTEIFTVSSNYTAGFGTTTPNFATLNLSSSTVPQLSLNDGLAGDAKWTLRNAGGNLYFSTTTAQGVATTSSAAFTVSGVSGSYGSAIGSSSPNAIFTSESRAGKANYEMFIGSTTPLLVLDNSGHLFLPKLVVDAAAHTYTVCGEANTFELRFDTTTCVLSAKKFKTNIQNLDIGLKELMQVRPVQFNYKPTGDATYDNNINIKHQQIGVIADEVEKIDSRLVTYDNKGEIKGFNYEFYTAWLTKSIQELAQAKGVVRRNLEENWQDLLIGLLIIYVIYNEYDKRKRK